uniref:EF-hand domain-containing protein n=1 Tax=Apteryx owenii TaxID=8824 RepID=A0A8B9QNA5_APTOW
MPLGERLHSSPSPSHRFVKMSQACQTPRGPLSELERSIDTIIDVFHQYSRREGDKDTLTNAELKLLIERQLVNYLKVSGGEAGCRAPCAGREPGCAAACQTPSASCRKGGGGKRSPEPLEPQGGGEGWAARWLSAASPTRRAELCSGLLRRARAAGPRRDGAARAGGRLQPPALLAIAQLLLCHLDVKELELQTEMHVLSQPRAEGEVLLSCLQAEMHRESGSWLRAGGGHSSWSGTQPCLTGLHLPSLALPLQHVKNQVSIDQIFKDLDTNKDHQLSFGEVMLLIIRVTIATHDHLHFCEDQQHGQQHGQQGQQHGQQQGHHHHH